MSQETVSLEQTFSEATEAMARSAGRNAQMQVEDLRTSITDPALVQMLFDGTPPRAIIEHNIATAQWLKSRGAM